MSVGISTHVLFRSQLDFMTLSSAVILLSLLGLKIFSVTAGLECDSCSCFFLLQLGNFVISGGILPGRLVLQIIQFSWMEPLMPFSRSSIYKPFWSYDGFPAGRKLSAQFQLGTSLQLAAKTCGVFTNRILATSCTQLGRLMGVCVV